MKRGTVKKAISLFMAYFLFLSSALAQVVPWEAEFKDNNGKNINGYFDFDINQMTAAKADADTRFGTAGAGSTASGEKLVPVESSKDIETKTIRVKMARPESPENAGWMEFKYDPNEINDLSVKRQEMIAQSEDYEARYAFTREYLSLPADMPENEVIGHLMAMNSSDAAEMQKAYEAARAGAQAQQSFGAFLKIHFNLKKEASATEALLIYHSSNEETQKDSMV